MENTRHPKLESELSLEARELIRSFILRLVIPSGIGLTVLSFALGFFVNDFAKKQAYVDAYANAYSEAVKMQSVVISDSASRVAQAEANVVVALAKMQEALKIAKEIEQVKAQIEQAKVLTQTDAQVAVIADSLAKNADFSSRITATLGTQLAVTNKWVRNIYFTAASTGMPRHEGANGWWQRALIDANPAVTTELR